MRWTRIPLVLGVVFATAILGSIALFTTSGTKPASAATVQSLVSSRGTPPWAERDLRGTTVLKGQVPLAVANRSAGYVGPFAAKAMVRLNFSLPLRDMSVLNRLIALEAKTHQYPSRAQLYARFAPSKAQFRALRSWLEAKGFQITHVGADRLAMTAVAPAATVDKALHVKLNEYIRPAFTFDGVKVASYEFYANASAPVLPARLGVQTISGLSDVDRFFTSAQLAAHNVNVRSSAANPLSVDTRSGGYFPADVRSMYDVSGHGYDGTGQTMGFTLWGAGETQGAMTAFATATGDQAITVDPPCTATGNNATTPSSCATTQTVAGDHLLSILENGNTNNQFGGNEETALDIEQAHGIATHAGMKYYLADCTASPPAGSGLTNGSSCNGTDVGLEDAVEDAANDPTLHSVSDSWAFGGEAEWGLADPFLVATQNSFAIAAAAGTTFYFSTGDTGTYQSGYPSDSPYVVGVGGTGVFSTASLPATVGTGPGVLSTELAWAAGGSWCSNIITRPSWQNISAVNSTAPCPGRAIPDVSAVADSNTPVKVSYSTSATANRTSSVAGTSVAAPEMNGLEAVTESFIAAQNYGGNPTPAIGFEAPMIYQLGGSANYNDYFRDVLCGNTASPASGPDGDAAGVGWDPATGFGAPDWFHFATGYAIALGATGLSTPSSDAQSYSWTCAKTPSNSSERSISFPSSSVGFAVGAASGTTPWPATFLPSSAWGAVNTFFTTSDGGNTWTPSNSDMLSIACTSTTACVEVGDGGVIKVTSDGGTTWTAVSSPTDKALTRVTCPTASICYAAGDRGIVIKSTDGGQTWSYLESTDGNPVYGLTCPSANVCYITDIYAHIVATTDGGATWTWQTTPVTTPGLQVPGSGGPNPFAGLFGVSCVSTTSCIAVGGYPPTGTDPPIVATTDGGSTWTLETSNAGSGHYLNGVACLPATTTCYAVGRSGAIVTTTDLLTWTTMTSGTTNSLTGITCVSTTSCVATGQNGTIDVLSGSTWTASTGNFGSVYLADVTCPGTTTCFSAGKQGVTIGTTNLTSWTQQAGGGTTQQMNSISCPSTGTCFTVGNSGTILVTTNGGQTWLPQTSGTTNALNGVSCTSTTACVAVGASGTVRFTSDGLTWQTGTSGTTNAFNGVSCAAGACTAVGASGTIKGSSDGGSTWSTQTSGTTAALSAVACPSTTCFADGAVVSGSAVMLQGSSGTWASEASHSAQALSAITCLDNSNCFAGGAIGTVITTTDGLTWTQQGNPLSGPVAALNPTSSSTLAINGVACSTARCAFGTGSYGDIMTSPLLTVTVNTTSTYGTTPALSGLSPGNAAISYNPSGEAGNVTGTLTCSTTATNASDVGSYPISACSGLADSGYTVVYDYADSSHTVVIADQAISIGTHAPSSAAYGTDFAVAATAPGGAVTYGSSGSCSNIDADFTMTSSTGTCTVTYDQAGGTDYNAAPELTETVNAEKADQTIVIGTDAPSSAVYGTDFTVAAIGGGSGNPVTYGSSGGCTHTGADFTMTSGSTDCTVTFDQAGNVSYNAATRQTETVTAVKANQTITFATPSDRTYGDANFDPSATASSGYSVSYGASGSCSIVSGNVHITGAGSCSVTASQAGDSDYNAASDVQRTFSIGKAALSITANNRQKYFDQPLTLGTTAFTSSGLVGSESVSGVTLTSSGAAAGAASGNYSIVPSNAVAGPGTNLGNYTVTLHNGTLHVSAVGIIGLNGVSVATSGGKIDSFDSSAATYGSASRGSAALVMSNGALSFSGVALLGSAMSTQGSVSVAHSASVSGDVTAGTSASIRGSVGGTVTRNSPSTALAVPTVAACSPYSGKSDISGGKFNYSPGTGNLVVKAGIVKLVNGTYCFHSVTIYEGAVLFVSGPVAIHLTGKLTGKGHIENTTNLPARLNIDSSYTGSNGVAIVGAPHAAMTLVAPRTDVTISGGPFFGTLLANTVSLTGGISFHADMR